jgi:hypothetical protein
MEADVSECRKCRQCRQKYESLQKKAERLSRVLGGLLATGKVSHHEVADEMRYWDKREGA